MRILDVGAGFIKYPGAISIDTNLLTNPDVAHNLNSYPWPFKDSEFDVIYSSHCLEHLSDPQKAVEEMWRIGKPGARIIIKVPHFSSRVAWTDIEHVKAFTTNSMRKFTKEFAKRGNTRAQLVIEKTTLRWQQLIEKEFAPPGMKKFLPLIELFNTIISGLANLNIEFCERIWCYYVGGMGEVEFNAKIVKEA